MLYILFFLSLFSSLLANNQSASVTENDPSSFVEGVNMITGDFCMQNEYYTVAGVEPIHFKHVYVSNGLVLNGYEHLTAVFALYSNTLEVTEPNGTCISYRSDPKNGVRSYIGDLFYGESKKKKNISPLRYYPRDLVDQAGISNTSKGRISGQTALQNQYIVFDPVKHPKGKSFDLYAADGTIRRYVNLKDQKKDYELIGARPFRKKFTFAQYTYKLVSKELPNGHVIEYQWDSKNRLCSIQTMNRSKSKIFSSIRFPSLDLKKPIPTLSLSGSDGQTLTIDSKASSIENIWVSAAVRPPNHPDIFFNWAAKDKQYAEKIKKFPYLSFVSLPDQRTLHIKYEDKWGPDQSWRVKTLSSPIGKDAAPLVTHTFCYDKQTSYVIDMKGNKTQYRWNDKNRLTSIKRFVGLNQLQCEEHFVWDNSRIKCKSFFDQDQNCIWARTFAYDSYGNVIKESFYGNLSGKEGFVKMGPNHLPTKEETANATTLSQ